MRSFSVEERRARLITRHHLAGDAAGPEAVTRALLALHATDPGAVFLSVLARSDTTTLADVSAALYERHRLVRWMAMRRTLFVFDVDDIPLIQAAAGAGIAAMLRRQLLTALERNGTEPPIAGDPGAWLTALEDRVAEALAALGAASGAQLAAAEPGLATVLLARTPSERDSRLTSRVLTLMAADARIVRGDHTGAWTSRPGRWEPLAARWPDGLATPETAEAQRELARRWLARFGPATVEDLRWWTGWSLGVTRAALAGLDVLGVDLHGEAGIALAADVEGEGAEVAPVATLLPALDPTPMGYTRREWFLGIDRALIFDRAGNIGPTVWWNGEIVGAWTVPEPGQVRFHLAADRGAEAAAAVETAAERLAGRLGDARVLPSFPTALERSLRG